MSNNEQHWGPPPTNEQPMSQVTTDSVHEAHSLLAAYPMASTTPSAHVARHLSNGAPAAPPSFVQHNYYTLHASFNAPPPYTEYAHEVNYLASAQQQSTGFWENAVSNSARLIREQAGPSYPYPSQYSPPGIQPSSYSSNSLSNALFQQVTPANAYPTPPPPSIPSSSSLAGALGPLPAPRTYHPPEESAGFFNNFIATNTTENQALKRLSTPPARPVIPPESPDPLALTARNSSSSVTTPRKRKAYVELVSPTIKRIQSRDGVTIKLALPSSSSATPSTLSRTPVPITPTTASTSLKTPTSRGTQSMRMKPYVSIPRPPWLTPSSSRKARSPDDLGGYGSPSLSSPVKSARKTGDRDERVPVEKFVELLEDIFEAEDNLPPDVDVNDLPTEFFSREMTIEASRPHLSPNLIRKLTKSIGAVARPGKRLKAGAGGLGTPKGKVGRMSEVDSQMLARILRMVNRSVKFGEEVDPFAGVKKSKGAQEKLSPKKKKGKGKSPTGKEGSDDAPMEETAEAVEEAEVDLDKLTRTLKMARDSVLAAECCVSLLASDRLPKQLYSEELITTCLGSIKNQLTRIIYPFVESFSPETPPSPIIRHLEDNHKKLVTEIFQTLSAALPRIGTLVSAESVSMSDSIIIQAVYISIGPFFVVDGTEVETKSAKKGKGAGDNVLGKSSMKGIRMDALSLIRSIFANREDQRPWIIEEILGSLIKLSDTKQKAGQFRLRDGRSIRTVSALLLQLVQTSAHDVRIAAGNIRKARQRKFALRRQESLNENQPTPQEESFLDENDNEEIKLYHGGLESAVKVAKTIIIFLTQRSGKGKTTKNSNEQEYRLIFENLIHDLLAVLHWPEWPAASLLLSIACKYMVSFLDDVKTSNHHDNNAMKTMALDHLGIVAARIRATALKIQYGEEVKARGLKPLDEIVQQLGTADLQKLLAAHQEVAAHLGKRSADDQAYDSAQELTAATLGHELAAGLRQINLRVEEEDIDDMNLKGKAAADASKLLKFGEKIKTALREVWKDQATDVFDVGSQEEVARVDRLSEEIGSIQNLKSSFQPILGVVLSALDAQAIFMRTKALRALGQIVTADPSILSAVNVRRAIETHLLDSSPQVRDAAVELIGKYMVDSPDVAGDYYSKIADRMADTGLSVRKRVIKLLKSYYGVVTDTSIQVDIATRMVFRMMDEDDSVKDLALKTIEDLWFPTGSAAPCKPRSSGARDKMALLSKVAVIMAVTAHFRNEQSPLEDILHHIITSKEPSSTEMSIMHAHYVEICEVLIDGLVDATDFPGFTVLNCVRTIYLFTSAYPAVLSGSNASILLPYIKAPESGVTETFEDQTIAIHLLRIFRATVPHMPKTNAKFAQDLQKVILSRITKPTGAQGLQENVACVCTVASSLTHNYSPFVVIIKRCNASIQSALKCAVSDLAPQTVMFVIILSLFVEHCDFDSVRAEYPDLKKDLDSISEGSITQHVYASLVRLHQKYAENSAFQKRILQCLGFLYRAHPTFMTSESSSKIMDTIFESPEEEPRANILKIIQDFLISESAKHSAHEKESNKKGAKATSINMDELVGNTDGFADSGVSSAIVQRYFNPILDSALSQNRHIQESAVDILSFTVKQGLAHPLQSFPIIVALETSNSPSMSNRASALHAIMNAKHATLINSRYPLSARASFDYQVKLCPGSVKGFRLQPSPVALLQRWYSLVREKRLHRQDFLKSLVKVFQEKEKAVSQSELDFMRYMAENFSAFEYKTQEEVLTVIKHLTNVLSTTGMAVLEQVSPSHLLSHLRQPGPDVGMADTAETSDDQLDQIPLMRTSVAIAMVMLLKAHLKTLYSLSEEKCTKFVVGKKSAAGDKPAIKRHDKPISWDKLPFAISPILTTAHVNQQKAAFLAIWNEDGVSGEPDDELDQVV